MSTPVTICNLALAHVGAAQQVTSIDPPDGSAVAGYCARFYPVARREMLEHAWRFATTRTPLALSTASPPVGWLFAYAVPNNCISPLRVPMPHSLDMGWLLGQEVRPVPNTSAEFEIEGGLLFTNQPEAELVHTQDVVDTSKFTPGFVAAFGKHLGGYLAGVIIKGREGAQLRLRLQQEARAEAEAAAARDANAQQAPRHLVPDSIAARA